MYILFETDGGQRDRYQVMKKEEEEDLENIPF